VISTRSWVADVIRSARHRHGTTLLTEIERAGRRSSQAQVVGPARAADGGQYVLKEGNRSGDPLQRGIRTFGTGYRFTLDLMAVRCSSSTRTCR
jgi:3-deoxy-D-arabino-heptulosonate 7-phosphate (DAHP) synthase